NAVRVAADGTHTALPLGAGFVGSIGQEPTSVVTVDGSRHWIGTGQYAKALGTIAPGETTVTQPSGQSAANALDVTIADGTLYMTGVAGVHRVPGGGLPSALNTAAPELVKTITDAFDAVFVDTNGGGGTDTLYVSRTNRGLFKYVRSGDGWEPKGY